MKVTFIPLTYLRYIVHRCRHDIAYAILKLCDNEPTYVSEMFSKLHMKYPTILSAINYLIYRYSIIPVNPDGTVPWEATPADDTMKFFDFASKQYPYFITRAGRLLLGRLEGWTEMDRLADKFTVEDYFSLTQDTPDSLFLKPDRFLKPNRFMKNQRKRNVPRPRNPMTPEKKKRIANAFTDDTEPN